MYRHHSRISHRILFARLSTIACAWLITLVNFQAAAQQNVHFLQNINLAAGSGSAGYTGDGGPAVIATFATGGRGAVSDSSGNFYILDTGNNVIRKVTAATGIVTTFAGGATTVCSVGDSFGNGCPATQAILKAPWGIRYYRGDIYITDGGDDEVRVVSGATGIISDFYGTGKSVGVIAGGKAANVTAVNDPVDIVFDGAGNAYVLDESGASSVTKVAATAGAPGSGIVSIVTGNATNSGDADTGDGGLATAALISVSDGLGIDQNGNLYIASNYRNTVREINMVTGIISTVVGPSGGQAANFAGDGGPANLAVLSAPGHIAFDGTGNMYIADSGNHRVRMVTAPSNGASYGIITTISGSGTDGNSGNGGPAMSGLFWAPIGVDFTPAGDLIVWDDIVRQLRIIGPPTVYSATAVLSTSSQTATVTFINSTSLKIMGIPAGYPDFAAGTPSGCSTGTTAAAGTTCSVKVTFQPVGAGNREAPLSVQSSTGVTDNLPLTGLGNAPVAVVLPGIISAVAGTGSAGNSGDTGPDTAAQLDRPLGVAVDGQNNYYIADSANNEIRKITAATGIITRVAGTGAAGSSGDGSAANSATLNAPAAVAVDGAGNLYIADTGNNRIRLVNASTGIISTFAGTGVAGYAGDGLAASAAQFSAPRGICLSPGGVLYVADTGNNAIRMLGTRSGNLLTPTIIYTIAGNGTAGYTGDSAEAQLAKLTAPTGVTVDASGNVYIADSGNQVIREVTNGIITTFAGSNLVGYANGPLGVTLFNDPTQVSADAAGNLYVADTGNDAIRRLSGGMSTTVVGTGKAGFTGQGISSTLATLNAPQGLALDLAGNILVEDTGNNQLRSVNVSSGSLVFPPTNPNTSSSPQAVAVSNAGNLPLMISSVTISAGFAEQPSGAVDCNGSSVSLAPGTACEASIVFTPTALQNYIGSLVVTDNSQSQTGAVQTIALSGVGANVYNATISVPSGAVAGMPFAVTVTVTNPTTTYEGTIHFSTSDPSSNVVLPANYTFSAADKGQHLFTGVQLDTAGIQSITVTDTLTPATTATALVTVTGGPAASLVIVSGNQQSTLINSSFPASLVVEALDAQGNPSPGAILTFTAPSSGADAAFNGSATFTGTTNTLGRVTTPLPQADGVTGTYAVVVSTAAASSLSYTLTNTSNIPAGFNLSSNPSGIYSLPPGSSATATITITPVGGFNSPVNVSCTGATAPTTCQTSEPTVAPSGNGTSTQFTVTITTVGPVTVQLRRASGEVFICLLLLPVGAVLLNKRKRLQALCCALFCCIALISLNGCGGSSHYSSDTLPGSFTLTVSGSSGTITSSTSIQCFVAGQP